MDFHVTTRFQLPYSPWHKHHRGISTTTRKFLEILDNQQQNKNSYDTKLLVLERKNQNILNCDTVELFPETPGATIGFSAKFSIIYILGSVHETQHSARYRAGREANGVLNKPSSFLILLKKNLRTLLFWWCLCPAPPPEAHFGDFCWEKRHQNRFSRHHT